MHQMGARDEHLWNMVSRNIVTGRRSFGSSSFLRLSPFSVGDNSREALDLNFEILSCGPHIGSFQAQHAEPL